MLALPFPPRSFDLVTTGYGLRNVPELAPAIDEIAAGAAPRRPGVVARLQQAGQSVVRAVYLTYLTIVGGALGWVLHRDPDTYRYIPASIRRYPGAVGVTRLMEARGFVQRASTIAVLGGLMAIHHARLSGRPDEGKMELDTSKWSGEGEFTAC